MLGFNGKALAGIVLAWSGILAGFALGKGEPAARDRLGDPLPLGAVARLGTVRLRGCGNIHTMTFSRDGKWLATLDDNAVRVWSVATGRELAYVVQHYNNAMCGLTFSADGKTLVSAGDGSALLLHDLSALSEKAETPTVLKKPRLAIPHRGNTPVLLAFLPDDKTLLSGDSDGQVHLWDAANGRELRTFGTIAKALHRYALSPDGKTLAIAPYGQAPALWDVETGKRNGRMPGREVVLALAFSPDGKILAAGIDASDAIRLFDVATRKEVRSLPGRKKPPLSSYFGIIGKGLAFLPDGKTLVALDGQLDDKLRLWDVESGKQRRTIQGWRNDGVLALSPDGRIVAAAGSNGAVRLWELASGKALHDDLRQGSVEAVTVSPDGRQVAVGSYDGVVRLYEHATGIETRSFPAEPHAIDHLIYTPDGKALFVSVAYHPAKLCNVASGKELHSFPIPARGMRGVMRAAAFSPSGAELALAEPNSSLQIVDPVHGKVLRRLGEKQPVHALAFSPDGAKLVGGGERSVHLWEVVSGKELWNVHNTTGDIAAIDVAPEGDLVATGDYGQYIHLLSVSSGEVVRSFPAAIGLVHAVAFSPDGRLLAVAGDQNDVQLLETATGTEARRLRGHRGPVWTLAFSSDGRSLVSGSFDATALVWDMTGRAFENKPGAALSDADLAKWWSELGAADGGEGYSAVWSLVRSGKQGIAFLQARQPESRDDQTISRLIAQLDDDAFTVREKASAALTQMGNIQTPLKAALAKKPSLEVRRRIEAILEKLGDKGDAWLRCLRGVTVLEYADAPEAGTLLQRLADNDSSKEIRRAARRALKRRENAASKP